MTTTSDTDLADGLACLAVDSAPPRATAITLDHQRYPHILNAIVSYAPHESLIALRAASRHLRNRCDDKMAAHLVLNVSLHASQNAWAMIIKTRGNKGRVPCLFDWHHMRDAGDFDKWYDMFATGNDLDVLAHTRVLDLVGALPMHVALILGKFKTLHTLRCDGPPPESLAYRTTEQIRTVVVFTDLERDWLGENLRPPYENLPPNITKLVVVVAFDDSNFNLHRERPSPSEIMLTRTIYSDDLAEIVYVLRAYNPAPEYPQLKVLLRLITVIVMHKLKARVKYTFVVNHRYGAKYKDAPPVDENLFNAKLRGMINAQLARLATDMFCTWDQETMDAVKANIEVVTLKEYVQRVGAVTATLETDLCCECPLE